MIVEFEGAQHEFPDDATPQEITAALNTAHPQQRSPGVLDYLKAGAKGVAGGLINTALDSGRAAMIEMGQDPESIKSPTPPKPDHPPTRGERYAETVGSFLGTPATYLGPGGIIPKVATGVAAALGSEAAGQAAEGSKAEPWARVAGGMAGGKLAGRVGMASRVPTTQQVTDAAGRNYDALRNSGVTLDPAAVDRLATGIEGQLTPMGLNARKAPGTYGDLNDMRGGTPDIVNLHTTRQGMRETAQQTNDFKATPDAKAAGLAKKTIDQYMGAIPPGDVIGGNPADVGRNLAEGNANYYGASRSFDLEKAIERARDSGGSTGIVPNSNLGNQVRQKLKPMADEDPRIRSLARDTDPVSRIYRVLGAGGHGVVSHTIAGAAGAGIGAAGGPAGSAIGAVVLPTASNLFRRAADARTIRNVNNLAEQFRVDTPYGQSFPQPPSVLQRPSARSTTLRTGTSAIGDVLRRYGEQQ